PAPSLSPSARPWWSGRSRTGFQETRPAPAPSARRSDGADDGGALDALGVDERADVARTGGPDDGAETGRHDDDGRNTDAPSVLERQTVPGPHAPVVVVDGDERTGVVQVGNVHAAELPLPLKCSASAAAISARASASSSGVKAPCSAPRSFTAARPARSRRSRSAAPAMRLESGMPSSAAPDSASARDSSRVMVAFLVVIHPLWRGTAPVWAIFVGGRRRPAQE